MIGPSLSGSTDIMYLDLELSLSATSKRSTRKKKTILANISSQVSFYLSHQSFATKSTLYDSQNKKLYTFSFVIPLAKHRARSIAIEKTEKRTKLLAVYLRTLDGHSPAILARET